MKQYFNDQIRSFDLPVVGLTKSGHVVYGPYWPGNGSKVAGNVLDSCNGWFMPNPDTTSSTKWLYGYVATEFHPYGPACFGPANWPERSQLPQLCSANPRNCGAVQQLSESLILLMAGYLIYLF